jgi:hypothetical protein
MKTQQFAEANVVKAKKIKTQNWYAWIDKMPPPPDALHVRGEVVVGNPGIDVFLYKKQPQGFNPTILLLDLLLIQRPGIWPTVETVKPAAYDEVGRNLPYVTVEIFNQGQSIASVPVEIVQ